MKRHKLRTLVVAMALVVGVALVGALLALVDTQRQFSLQAIGAQTGGYDLSIKHTDTAPSVFFDIAPVDQIIHTTYAQVAATHPRIQGDAEARLKDSARGTGVKMIALDTEKDQLSKVNMLLTGSYPPQQGQVFLNQMAADLLQAKVGDEINLSYVRLVPRDPGKEATTDISTARTEAVFTIAGIGLVSGLGNDVGAAVLIRLQDAQTWLDVPAQAERLLVVWNSDTAAGSDAKVAVSRARDIGDTLKNAVQEQLGSDFVVEFPKYRQLDASAQGFVFQQAFITLYGLLSMGIIGLMVNALMMSTVVEQKHDLAVLRVIGAPRTRLFETVIIEVALLGAFGVICGLLLGRALNDYVITPLLLMSLELPPGVRAAWSLESVLTPTLITALVLAVATISPARTAAATKVMVVLNPAAADQPTLEDLSKLREKRANYGLLLTGFVLLLFCGVIMFTIQVLFTDQSAFAITIFAAFLLMVVGMSLVFFFVTTPLQRVLIALSGILNRRATFFISRYALRGKSRNSLISLMVVASAVLPCWLGTQLALEDANLETDFKFSSGAPAEARYFSAGNVRFFGTGGFTSTDMGAEDLAEMRRQPGIATAVATAEQYRDEVSDRVQLRSTQAGFIGVEGDLNQVLYPEFMQWTAGNATALTHIATDPDAVVIAGGLSDLLDLKLGDTLRVKGAGIDHERMMTIVGIATRLPGFNGITRNLNRAQGGGTNILMHIDTYRELQHDPAEGVADADAPLFTRILMSVEPGADEVTMGRQMRETLSQDRNINVRFTREAIESSRGLLQQGRIFIVLLAGVSMVTAVFGVLAVMYTAVISRRIEIAMLKALGASGRSLRAIFIGEAVIITSAAALAGIIAGTLLGYALDYSMRYTQEIPMQLAFDSTTAIVVIVMVCLAAIFSALLATQPVLRQKAVMILRER